MTDWAPAVAALVGGLLSGPAGQAAAKLLEKKFNHQAWQRDRREPLYAAATAAYQQAVMAAALDDAGEEQRGTSPLSVMEDFLAAVSAMKTHASTEANEQADHMSDMLLNGFAKTPQMDGTERVAMAGTLFDELKAFQAITRRDLYGEETRRSWWKRDRLK